MSVQNRQMVLNRGDGPFMKQQKISVIMLTYNRETLVSRAIESMLAQTFSDFEFIVVDNGSTDASAEIASEYAKKTSNMRVIHKERGNIGSGRNAGLDAASGEYIAFIDDDDYCEPDFLQFLYGLATNHAADVSICGSSNNPHQEKGVYSAEDAVIHLLWRKLYNVQFPTKLIHRKLFDGVRFSQTAKYDDIELMPKIIASAQRVAYHGLPKYTFDRQSDNHSAWTTNHSLLESKTLAEYLLVIDKRTEWLSAKFPVAAPQWRYFKWSFMLSMVEKVSRLELADCYGLREKMLAELYVNRTEFRHCEWIYAFEEEWVTAYVK